MPDQVVINHLRQKCLDVRHGIIEMIYAGGSGHPSGSLSAVEILTPLYFHVMQIRPEEPVGGLGCAVAEVVTGHLPVPVIRVGIRDTFGEVGTPEWLAEKFGVSAGHITQAAREAPKRKNQ